MRTCSLLWLSGFGMIGAACTGSIGTSDGSPTSGSVAGENPSATTPGFSPAPLRLRTLLGVQYRNAIGDLLGSEAAAAVKAPPDLSIEGFEAVGASQTTLSPSAIRIYEQSAYAAAQAVLANATERSLLIGCTPTSAADTACMRSFVARLGRRAWRRPLLEEELTTWSSLGSEAAAATGNFNGGAEFVIAGFLQSPDFIYQVEIGTPTVGGVRKLTGLELATRLSFFLTGTTPTSDLLEAAERGELDTVEGVSSNAAKLLATPAARRASADFFDELLEVRGLELITKDSGVFPTFSPSLAIAMRQETRLLVDEIIWRQDTDLRSLFDANYTFVDSELAKHYAIAAPSASGFSKVAFAPDGPRIGVFGHASLLSVLAHADSTSPTFRGKFIRQRILCESVGKPPPDVNTTFPPDTAKTLTMKERLEEHRRNPVCASCHQRMDPIGLGLEHFDGIGRFRTVDLGKPIDTASDLDGTKFDGARELAAVLRNDPRTPRCLTRNLFRVATGHDRTAGEAPAVENIDLAFAKSGYRFKELAIAIVTSPAFRFGALGDAP